MLTWARMQKTRVLSSAEAELYAIGSGEIEGLGVAQLLQEWQCKTVPLLWKASPSALAVQTQRTRLNEPCRAEDTHSAGMAENRATSSSPSIDSRQPGRPHDQGHDSRETDQVRTSLELARITLHRLEPTCTAAVTSATSDTATLSAKTYTVDSFQHQNHRRAAHGETCERLQRQESIRHNHSSQTILDNPGNAVTYAAPVSVVGYVALAPTVDCAASVTTMTVPTTVDTQPVADGSDYFRRSVTFDVWYTLWPDPMGIYAKYIDTCVDLDQYPNANIAERSLTSDTENSVEMSGLTYETGVHALHEWHQVSERCQYSEDHRSR